VSVVLTDLDVDADAPDLHVALSDPEVSMPWQGWPASQSVAETRARLAERAALEDVRGWCVRGSDSGPALGLIERIGTGIHPGIGWMMRRDRWGQGLTAAGIEIAVARMFAAGAVTVEAWATSTNLHSIRVAHRTGFAERCRFALVDENGTVIEKVVLGRDRGGRPSTLHRADPVLDVRDVAATADLLARGLGFATGFTMGGDIEPMAYAQMLVGPWTNANGIRLRRVRGPISAGVVTVEAGLPIDGLYRQAIAAGATVEGPPISLPWGPKEFVLVLPEGHRLEVVAAA
jgi:RimJ/RimL family protein N-acetyltransferase